jgi:hypothetical protein
MTLEEQITTALRGVQPGAPLVDPRTGRTWLLGLARALGGSVEDETNYGNGRAYRFSHTVRTDEERMWRAVLQVCISGVGPFATHTFMLRAADPHWWAHNIRTSRNGFYPEDAEITAKVRAWYQENGITEVDTYTQAQFAPTDLFPEETTLFQVLFRP